MGSLSPPPPPKSVRQHIEGLPGDEEIDEYVKGDNELMQQLIASHPCFSQELLRADVLQLLSNMTSNRTRIKLEDVPVVGRKYEEAYMRPPFSNERGCIRGDQCMCNFIAKIRHGADSDLAFIGCEFLLPEQCRVWTDSGEFPTRRGRCIICLRYIVTLLYTLARCNPRFHIHECASTQHASTGTGAETETETGTGTGTSKDVSNKPKLPTSRRRSKKTTYSPTLSMDVGEGMRCGSLDLEDCIPIHANPVDVADGYRRDKTLFVEEEYIDSVSMRETEIGSIAFRPFVRFCVSDYTYETDGHRPRIIQRNLGCDLHLNEYASPAMATPGALQAVEPHALVQSA
jgi:hypothetical protein